MAASVSSWPIAAFFSATRARRRSNSASSPRAFAAPTARLASLRSASAVSAAAMRRVEWHRARGSRRRPEPVRGGRARRRRRAALRGSGGCRAWGALRFAGVMPQGWDRFNAARRGPDSSGTESAVSFRRRALASSAACSAGSRSGIRSARTPAAPITRGSESATSRTPSTSGVTIDTEKTARSSRAMAAMTRARPAPMPYQVAPLPWIMV